ncbi:hypothetical protein HGRIS_011035 [Hohenbuehelia grisea]|uniref:Uncharacterized protein n=1 Tax=Hohenbuehelia grisea TaxID=104357 RepID=A0ABR3IYP5_9AGAR
MKNGIKPDLETCGRIVALMRRCSLPTHRWAWCGQQGFDHVPNIPARLFSTIPWLEFQDMTPSGFLVEGKSLFMLTVSKISFSQAVGDIFISTSSKALFNDCKPITSANAWQTRYHTCINFGINLSIVGSLTGQRALGVFAHIALMLHIVAFERPSRRLQDGLPMVTGLDGRLLTRFGRVEVNSVHG